MGEEPFETPQDYRSAEGPASLRRQSPVKPRQGGSRRGLAVRVGKVFLAVLLLGGAIWGARWAVEFSLSNARFRLAFLEIRGAEFVARSQIEEKFLSDRGRSVLRAPLGQRRREVEQIPWVRSATVGRILPNQLWVEVRERVPVAFLGSPTGMALVDEEGVILDSPPKASFKFPVVRGISPQDSPETRRARMRLFQALIADLNSGGAPLSQGVSEVDVQDLRDVRVVAGDSSGAVLLHLGRENFLARYRLYLGHIQEWKEKFPNLHSIDLRYDGQVVLNADPERRRAPSTGPGPSSGESRPEASLPVPPARWPERPAASESFGRRGPLGGRPS